MSIPAATAAVRRNDGSDLRCVLLASLLAVASTAAGAEAEPAAPLTIVDQPERFADGIASTHHADIRLTLSDDGRHALWFTRQRPGGPGSYDIWSSRFDAGGWTAAVPVSFNSTARDFDPAFSADGRHVYFCSDRAGGSGGSDLYRVAVTATGFGTAEHLGAEINSTADEFAPMLSPDGSRLLFSSDRAGGRGGHDLYFAPRRGDGFARAHAVAGGLNTAAHEFDATLLADGATLLFARARDFVHARVDLFAAAARDGRYDAGVAVGSGVNDADGDTYGPMLDWSARDRFTFSARRSAGRDMDLYVVRYRLTSPAALP